MSRPAIQVWRFADAPEDMRALSINGGDEDWLAVVPPEYGDEWIAWLCPGGPFGVCDVDEYPQPDGRRVFIGCHA